jgi:ABC-type histidine transport system ATPase subunit
MAAPELALGQDGGCQHNARLSDWSSQTLRPGKRNVPKPDAKTVLAAENIRKSFQGIPVLKGISLEAREHDVISMIGASGSGKSTFLRCLNLLEVPDEGAISVLGEKILLGDGRANDLHPRKMRQVNRLRAGIGMVFQNFNLWPHLTVMENVTIAPITVLGLSKAEARGRAEAYLSKVGIYDKRDSYPSHISGGQQQRCAIARALAMEPGLLLFDEPTSALDPELVGEVLRVMRDLAAEGRTMIVVTHEMAFARDVSTEVVFLSEGLIEERGKPEQVFSNPSSDRCRRFLKSVL